MKNLRLLLLVLAIIVSTTSSTLSTASYEGLNEDPNLSQITNSIIINFGHIPYYPLPNQLITIFAVLNIVPIDFTNVTLVYQINQSGYNRVLMTMTNNNQFEYNLAGQEANSIISYRIELFVNNNFKDKKPDTNFAEISINSELSDRIVTVTPGLQIILNPANYTITTEDKTLEIQLNISKSIELFFNKIERLKVQNLQNYIHLSDLSIIEINDSEALVSAVLTINYDPILINEYRAVESSLKLLTRENSSYDWSEHPSIIDEFNNKILANVSHFSEWIVASPKSVLRLMQVENPEVINLESIGTINSIGSNVGNIRADNVTLSIFLPNGLFLNNVTSVYKIDSLYPLENISLTWSFFADEIGLYTIVFIFESINAENDVKEVQFEVIDASEKIVSEDSSSSKSPWNFSLTSIVISLTLLYLNKKKKRVYLKRAS